MQQQQQHRTHGWCTWRTCDLWL